ncbi:MAG: CoA transferase [Pseudomonadota bacterium]
MSGPLAGVQVVDLTTMIAGPLATCILADQGAEVIKIERPQGGDHARQVADRRGGFSASFLHNNRGKRSVTLDLKHARGRDAVLKLAARADVFVQNFRPGVVERLGLDEASVRAVRPDIVYASVSGFGFEGPWARRPVYDPLIQALSGLASVQGAGGRPRLVRTILPDKVTAIQASQAITAALFARARTGQGTHVQLSMLDTVTAFLWSSDMSGLTFVGDEAPAAEEAQSFVELIYQSADGYLAVSAHTDSTWAGLCRAVGRLDWLEDPRFSTVSLREINKPARLELTQSALIMRPTAEWLERLAAEDVPCAPVLSRSETLGNAQVKANGSLVEREHPQAGHIRQARPAARFDGFGDALPGHAQRLGADTRAVLGEAGYDQAEIDALIADGIATDAQEGDA